MSTVAGIVALIALLISGMGVFALYYALSRWLRGSRAQWGAPDHSARRRVWISLACEPVFIAGCVAVLIISPWGQHTILYLFGGMAVFFVVAIPIYTPFLARHQIREAERARETPASRSDAGPTSDEPTEPRH